MRMKLVFRESHPTLECRSQMSISMHKPVSGLSFPYMCLTVFTDRVPQYCILSSYYCSPLDGNLMARRRCRQFVQGQGSTSKYSKTRRRNVSWCCEIRPPVPGSWQRFSPATQARHIHDCIVLFISHFHPRRTAFLELRERCYLLTSTLKRET
jgi:hypothetical protein